MRTISIGAASDESAFALEARLVSFAPELTQNDGGDWTVTVHLGEDVRVGAVLRAIGQHAAAQAATAAVEIDGCSYTLEPRDVGRATSRSARGEVASTPQF